MKTRIIIIITICSGFLISCNYKKSGIKSQIDSNQIVQIIIQHYPAFHNESFMVFNAIDSTLTMQIIGGKVRWIAEAPGMLAEKTFASVNPFNIKISNHFYDIITDSIYFNNDDFVDMDKDCHDGVYSFVLYVFRNGRVESVELKNAFTDNHLRLFHTFIDAGISQNNDSLNIKYLNHLKKYYNKNFH